MWVTAGCRAFDPVGGINQSMCARVAGRLDRLEYGATIVDAGSNNAPEGTRTLDLPLLMRVLYPSELPARKRHAPYSSLSRSHIPQQGGTGANPISGRARPVIKGALALSLT